MPITSGSINFAVADEMSAASLPIAGNRLPETADCRPANLSLGGHMISLVGFNYSRSDARLVEMMDLHQAAASPVTGHPARDTEDSR